MSDLEKLWQQLNQKQRDIAQYLSYMPPPVLVDDLVSASGISMHNVLKAINLFRNLRLLKEKRDRDQTTGLALSKDLLPMIEGWLSNEQIQKIKNNIFAFYEDTLAMDDKKTLFMAELIRKFDKPHMGLEYLKNAAELLSNTPGRNTAIAYFDLCLRYFDTHKPTSVNAGIYLACILGKLLASRLQIRLEDQIALLERGFKTARQFKQWELLAKIIYRLTRALSITGKGAKAIRIINDAIKLTEMIDNSSVRIYLALAMSQLLFWKGEIAAALRSYEKLIGNLEEFGNDDASLMAGSYIGLINISNGRISRGIGMIEAVRRKAEFLELKGTIAFTNLLQTHALLEIGNITEAEAYLERALSFREVTMDRFMLLIANTCRAYILYSQKEYEKAFECHALVADYPRHTGYAIFRGHWFFEYLSGLETQGFVHHSMNFDSEVKDVLALENIHFKGVALRFRALRDQNSGADPNLVVADLKKSEKCLKQAGADIDLARTRIALGNAYRDRGQDSIGRQYHQKVWELFPRVDKTFFPKDLLSIISQEDKIALMIDRIIGINESLRTIQDTSAFLEKVLNVAMDFTMATQSIFIKPATARGAMQTLASRNIAPTFIASTSFRPVIELLSSIMLKGEELIFPGHAGTGALTEKVLRRAGIHSLILMAARMEDTVNGYLCLFNRLGGGEFPTDQLHYIRLLCNQISIGLANISMYQEMQELKNRYEEEAHFYKREMGVANPIEMIIGKSDVICDLKNRIHQVALTDSSVLITGETGVGKELVAKAIHNLGKRKRGSFVPVNLAALPPEIIAGELFGHEKGAYTGAHERQKGRFEISHKGTIFLDEIGDLPPDMQVKLLRVLQTGIFERVGNPKPITSDFRVISATNKDIQQDVKQGVFRQDLYYRLVVFPIHVPPLRERLEDIEPLAHYFLQNFCRKTGKHMGRIPDIELSKLRAYHWPGNVRELKNFIERSVILSFGSKINFSGLEYLEATPANPKDAPINLSLVEVERNHIEKVLQATYWKISGPNGAARILGLKPTTLHFRMKKMGIVKPAIGEY